MHQKTGLQCNKDCNQFLHWSMVSYGAEAWTLQKVDQMYLECFEMLCCRRTEKISWTDRVNKDEVLQRVKEERIIVQTVKRRKVNLIGDMLCWKGLLKHVVEGKVEGRAEVTGGRK